LCRFIGEALKPLLLLESLTLLDLDGCLAHEAYVAVGRLVRFGRLRFAWLDFQLSPPLHEGVTSEASVALAQDIDLEFLDGAPVIGGAHPLLEELTLRYSSNVLCDNCDAVVVRGAPGWSAGSAAGLGRLLARRLVRCLRLDGAAVLPLAHGEYPEPRGRCAAEALFSHPAHDDGVRLSCSWVGDEQVVECCSESRGRRHRPWSPPRLRLRTPGTAAFRNARCGLGEAQAHKACSPRVPESLDREGRSPWHLRGTRLIAVGDRARQREAEDFQWHAREQRRRLGTWWK